MPRSHSAHRFRVVSRCPACKRRLLSACTYRTCAETRDDRPTSRGKRYHACGRAGDVRLILDLQAEARRIFGDDIAPARRIGL